MIATKDLRALRAPALVAGCLLAAGANASSAAFDSPAAALDALRGNAENALQYRSDASSAYTLLRAVGSAPLSVDDAGAAPLSRALRFLDQFGAAVGVGPVPCETECKTAQEVRLADQELIEFEGAHHKPFFV